MPDTPEFFLQKILFSSIYGAVGITIFLLLVLYRLGHFIVPILVASPIFFIIMLFYLSRIPDFKIIKKQREINSEIVFATRFLIIELESGVPLYDCFKNLSRNYPVLGKYVHEITNKVDLGTQMEDALNDEIGFTPSANFRKVLWQIVNSHHTGADVSQSLKSVVALITEEQLIEVKEYGRKLNPLAMFYMILAVILPSIGITMFIMLSTFLGLKLSLTLLIVASIILGFIQFMFLAMIKSSRPAVGL